MSRVRTAETLEQWAASVAPTLDAQGWQKARRDADPQDFSPTYYYRRFSVEQARAMLAYRDKVTAGLSPIQRDYLLQAGYITPLGTRPSMAYTNARLMSLGAVRQISEGLWQATDFGCEIARVLDEGSPCHSCKHPDCGRPEILCGGER